MVTSEDYGEHGEYSVDDETQLQPEDTLDGELGHDVLDDGFVPPDRPRAAQSFGITAAEQQQGESLEQRLAQEEPDPALEVDPQSGPRSGPPTEEDRPAEDLTDGVPQEAGWSAGLRSPEEAAVHVVRDDT